MDRRDIGFRFVSFWFFAAIYRTLNRFEVDGTIDFDDPSVRAAVKTAVTRVKDVATARGFLEPENGWH
jgi:hypothetical protein